MGNDKYHGGGTPKGVPKPRRNLTKETSGVEARGYGDAYSDVKHACNRFLRERLERGVMPEKEAMPKYHFGKRSPRAGRSAG